MQEVVAVANMSTPSQFPVTGFRGARRGANIGKTREIWPTLDGFVSFGLRGGKARVPSLETLTRLVDAAVDCVERAKRVAAQWYHEATGRWPGSDANRVAHGKPPRGKVIGPG